MPRSERDHLYSIFENCLPLECSISNPEIPCQNDPAPTPDLGKPILIGFCNVEVVVVKFYKKAALAKLIRERTFP